MFGPKRLACFFWGRVAAAEVVAGPNVYICDEWLPWPVAW